VSLIELNAWKDEWLVNIGDLEKGKKKKGKSDKEKKKLLRSD